MENISVQELQDPFSYTTYFDGFSVYHMVSNETSVHISPIISKIVQHSLGSKVLSWLMCFCTIKSKIVRSVNSKFQEIISLINLLLATNAYITHVQ